MRAVRSIIAGARAASPRANDLEASNVPGLRETVFVAGARVERLYPFAPLPGCATMITLLTHGETCCIAWERATESSPSRPTAGR